MNLVDVIFELDAQLESLALYTDKQYNKGRIRDFQAKIMRSLLETYDCSGIELFRKQSTWKLPVPRPSRYIVVVPDGYGITAVPEEDGQGNIVFPSPVSGVLLYPRP